MASTWDLDLDNDVVERGAFKRTLNNWRASKGKQIIPLVDSHSWRFAPATEAVLGALSDARETDDGLETTFKVAQTPKGDALLGLLKIPALNGLSIGFEPVKWKMDDGGKETGQRPVRRIKEVKLREISVVIWGANPHATIDTDTVKMLIQKAKDHDLSDEEVSVLRGLQSEIKELLHVEPAGLAIDDPHRLELEAAFRDIRLARFGTR